jgi:hypothetical protein
MAKRRTHSDPFGDPPEGWEHEQRFMVNNRWIERGTMVRIRGERGLFRIIRLVRSPVAEWIETFDKDGRFRAFRPDRIRTVTRQKATTTPVVRKPRATAKPKRVAVKRSVKRAAAA